MNSVHIHSFTCLCGHFLNKTTMVAVHKLGDEDYHHHLPRKAKEHTVVGSKIRTDRTSSETEHVFTMPTCPSQFMMMQEDGESTAIYSV